MLEEQLRRDYGDFFQVVHFTIQVDHPHLSVEAKGASAAKIAESPRLLSKQAARGRESKDRDMLRRGIARIAVAFARGLNKLLGRKGAVWAERHHRRAPTRPVRRLRPGHRLPRVRPQAPPLTAAHAWATRSFLRGAGGLGRALPIVW